MTALLEDKGAPAEYVDLSNIIDWDAPQGLTQDFYRKLARVIGQRIQNCGDRVPVRDRSSFRAQEILIEWLARS